MRHAGTQEIETPRLLLRRLMPSDAPMMYANWANDPEVTRWLRWTPHKDVAETQELLSAWALLYPNEDYCGPSWKRPPDRCLAASASLPPPV